MSLFVCACIRSRARRGDFEAKKRQKKKKKTRSFVRSLALAFDDDDENRQNIKARGERTKKFLAPKKKTRAVPIQKKIFFSETERYVSLFLCSYLAFGRRFLSLYDTCESGERRRENHILSVFLFRKKVLTTTSSSADALRISKKRIQILQERESAFNSYAQATTRTRAELL